MGIQDSSGGGGGPLPMSPMQRQIRNGRNLAIASVGLATVAVGLSIFNIIQTGRLNTRADLADKQHASDSTRIAVVDSSRIADSTRNDNRFVLLEDNLAAVDKSAAKVPAVDTLKGRVGVLENRADKTDSAIAAIDSTLIRIQKTIDDLAGTDDSLKAQLKTVADSVSSLEEATTRIQMYLEASHLIDAWNTNRGGVPIFGGGRKKLPPMSGEDFNRMVFKTTYPPGIPGLPAFHWTLKRGGLGLLFDDPIRAARIAFAVHAENNGVKKDVVNAWLSEHQP